MTNIDNVIRIGKKLRPVEITLDIKLESNLEGRCEKYYKLDSLFLHKKPERHAKMRDVVSDRVLIIDTYAVYMFYLESRRIEVLFDLSELKSEEDIHGVRRVVLSYLS